MISQGKSGYDVIIDKALRRAAQKARMNAAATGTRLIIYEKGHIRRLRPGTRADIFKNFQAAFPVGQDALKELQEPKIAGKEFAFKEAKKKAVVIAEKREKYRPASKRK